MRVFLFLLISISGFAAGGAIEAPNKKLDLLAHEFSLKYAKEGLPEDPIDPDWLPHKDKNGLLNPRVLKQYRHMHAMIASAFFATRADQQKLSWKWLEDYECENLIACKDFQDVLENALKAHPFALKANDRDRAKRLHKRAKMKAETLAKSAPDRNGLCTLGSSREKWLELGYELYCPPYEPAVHDRGCANLTTDPIKCSSTEALKTMIEMHSHQMLLSSSYLETIKHKGPMHCSTKWNVEMICDGAVRREFAFECAREGAGYPAQIRCKQLQSE